MKQMICSEDFSIISPKMHFSNSLYNIWLLRSKAFFSIDGTNYQSEENAVLFLSPYQSLVWQAPIESIRCLSFHGDFYCIEYHKYEVACNGLLFNNAYLSPFVQVDQGLLDHLFQISEYIRLEQSLDAMADSSTASIIKSYLQLILALCSRQKEQVKSLCNAFTDRQTRLFEELLEQYHDKERRVLFYAERIGTSPEVLSRKSKQAFGKTPTQLIQDRVIIAAKRLLHLTDKSIKEIARELNFQDELYFSRYFKKATGLSPKHFREEVGISLRLPPAPPV